MVEAPNRQLLAFFYRPQKPQIFTDLSVQSVESVDNIQSSYQGCSVLELPHGHVLLCLDLIRPSTERMDEGMFRTAILYHMSRDGLRKSQRK